MLTCSRVTKRFGHPAAVDDVSFELPEGIGALLGPNGAGKSTLLKILAGLLPPDRGEVRIEGCDIAGDPVRIRRMIGVLPEDLGLFDALTVHGHLDLCGPIYGLSRTETRQRADALLRILGLEDGRYILSRPVPPRHAQKDRAGQGLTAQPARAAARRTVRRH